MQILVTHGVTKEKVYTSVSPGSLEWEKADLKLLWCSEALARRVETFYTEQNKQHAWK